MQVIDALIYIIKFEYLYNIIKYDINIKISFSS